MEKFKSDSYRRRILWAMFWTICACIACIGINDYKSTKKNYGYGAPAVLPGEFYQTYSFEREIEPTCVYIYDASMYIGESRVVEEGNEGTRRTTVLRTFYNGEQVGERIVENEVILAASPRVVALGTIEKPEYILPVEEYVYTSCFGPRWGSVHEGIDLAVPMGTEVKAAHDGVVIQSGWYGGYGICVTVDHGDNTFTRYGHLSQTFFEEGDTLTQGEVLALSGNTGNSTGPHLHFEIIIGEEPVDPVGYVQVE